jgi:redox-sensitive bicupin YhaK (pirin superfamily)
MDVPPHPHVGLQTVTYLFDGAVRHRDSLGSDQVIRPGDVNWMTAGRGIVHEERSVADAGALHGLQAWVALPPGRRDVASRFHHLPSSALPQHLFDRVRVRAVAGNLESARVATPTFSEVVYLDVELQPQAAITLPCDPRHELALYVVEGALEVGGTTVRPHELAILSDGDSLGLGAQAPTRVVMIGGEPMPDPTVIYWNFITDTLEEARAREADWLAGRNFPRMPTREA